MKRDSGLQFHKSVKFLLKILFHSGKLSHDFKSDRENGGVHTGFKGGARAFRSVGNDAHKPGSSNQGD